MTGRSSSALTFASLPSQEAGATGCAAWAVEVPTGDREGGGGIVEGSCRDDGIALLRIGGGERVASDGGIRNDRGADALIVIQRSAARDVEHAIAVRLCGLRESGGDGNAGAIAVGKRALVGSGDGLE